MKDGIFNVHSTSVSLVNCVYSGSNSNSGSNSGSGSAILVSDPSALAVEVRRCLFSRNSAVYGGSIFISSPSADVTIEDVCGYSSFASNEGSFLNVNQASKASLQRSVAAVCTGYNNVIKIVSQDQSVGDSNATMCSLSGSYLFMHHPSTSMEASRICLDNNNSSRVYGVSTSIQIQMISKYLCISRTKRSYVEDLLHFNIQKYSLLIEFFVFKKNDPELIHSNPTGQVTLKNGYSDKQIPLQVYTLENVTIGHSTTFPLDHWDVPFCQFQASSYKNCLTEFRFKKRTYVLSYVTLLTCYKTYSNKMK